MRDTYLIIYTYYKKTQANDLSRLFSTVSKWNIVKSQIKRDTTMLETIYWFDSSLPYFLLN